MVEFCVVNIASAVFLLKNNFRLSSIALMIGFCFFVYDKNNGFGVNYQHVEKGIYDIIMLLLFCVIKIQIFRKETTPFQIAHANIYNIFYLITVSIWCCQKYSFSYLLILFFSFSCIIIYLSISKVIIFFKRMEKKEKSDAIYLTTSIWVLYWWLGSTV